MMSILASIPSPSTGVWYIGPLPLRAYALAIICGILAAWWILSRRYARKGGPTQVVGDFMFAMVICGIIGGRLYHVITDYQLYFGKGRDPLQALAVWNGGLGIWGAITCGGIGAWLVARHYGLRLMPFGDAIAPALLVAQAIGRLGNYFNQELYGKATTLPWGLEIDSLHIVDGYPVGTTFHPTFLYEMLWCLAGAILLVILEKRFDLVGGQLFACYVMVYTSGRVWIEMLRIDAANHVLGLRLNVWTSIVVFTAGLIAFLLLRRRVRKNPEVNDVWISEAAREKFEASLESEGEKKAEEKEADGHTDDASETGDSQKSAEPSRRKATDAELRDSDDVTP